jgi:transcriptional regulator with XRE-family HTH domain
MRVRNSLTQQQVAERLNITRTAIGKYENENAYPDVEKLIALAKIYKCSVDYLIGLSDNSKVFTRNETAVLKVVTDIAEKENIIASGETITDGEYKKLAAEIETAHLSYKLYKRITKQHLTEQK